VEIQHLNFTLGVVDASYKPYQDTASSVGGHAVFIQGAPISGKSEMLQSTTLSPTEAELCNAIECVQGMLLAMRVLESIETHDSYCRQ
jgi:hypothetical protein